MQDGIGPTLRRARERRSVGLSEVEAATKIRPRYLRAMENEEWSVLPGGAYTRSFIRTYASYLGLDGERLVDEYRHETLREERRGPRSEQPPAQRRPSRLPTGRFAAAAVSLLLVAVVVVVGLAGEGREGGAPATRPGARRPHRHVRTAPHREIAARRGVAVKLAATAEVWVCLLDAGGEPLIDGRILEAGAEEGPFRSSRFTVSFGNGEVELLVDGRREAIPATASPLGYEIDSGGSLRPLAESTRPTCT